MARAEVAPKPSNPSGCDVETSRMDHFVCVDAISQQTVAMDLSHER
jgi:hypothetical protein